MPPWIEPSLQRRGPPTKWAVRTKLAPDGQRLRPKTKVKTVLQIYSQAKFQAPQ